MKVLNLCLTQIYHCIICCEFSDLCNNPWKFKSGPVLRGGGGGGGGGGGESEESKNVSVPTKGRG